MTLSRHLTKALIRVLCILQQLLKGEGDEEVAGARIEL